MSRGSAWVPRRGGIIIITIIITIIIIIIITIIITTIIIITVIIIIITIMKAATACARATQRKAGDSWRRGQRFKNIYLIVEEFSNNKFLGIFRGPLCRGPLIISLYVLI